MIQGFQPISVTSLWIFLSRSIVLAIFISQYARFVCGMRDRLHPCQCQKHPFTKTATLCFGSTMSGLPGSLAECNRKRNPAACSAFRTFISGLVSVECTRLITQLRVALSKVSMVINRNVRLFEVVRDFDHQAAVTFGERHALIVFRKQCCERIPKSICLKIAKLVHILTNE